MLELAILGLLKEQDLHGYELKKRLVDTLGVASGVSFGSLYPALGRLERSGAVHTVEAGAGDGPALSSLAGPRSRAPGRGGRARKVYGITSRGESLFEELLVRETGSVEDSRLFHIRLAFARYLATEARLGMLERRRAQLLERLNRATSRSRGGRLDTYVTSLLEHDRESTEHDLTWIERLIARERTVGRQSSDAPTASTFHVLAAPASTAPPVATGAPTLSGLWRARHPETDPRAGRSAPSHQEETTV